MLMTVHHPIRSWHSRIHDRYALDAARNAVYEVVPLMMLIAIAVSLVMAAVAAIHVYWGLGGLWPGNSLQDLANIVVGDKNMTRMPPAWLTLSVSAVLVGVVLWPLVLAPIAVRFLPLWLIATATYLLAAVFLVRGFASYVPAVARLNDVEPFATLNRRYYGPLCIALGAGYFALAYHGGMP
jgi:hypothetical protein